MRTSGTSSKQREKDKQKNSAKNAKPSLGKRWVLKTRDTTMSAVSYVTGMRMTQTMDEFTATYRDVVVGLGNHVLDHDAWIKKQEEKNKKFEDALARYMRERRRLHIAFMFALALSALSLTTELISWMAR